MIQRIKIATIRNFSIFMLMLFAIHYQLCNPVSIKVDRLISAQCDMTIFRHRKEYNLPNSPTFVIGKSNFAIIDAAFLLR